MEKLTSTDIALLMLALATMLGLARIFGELFTAIRQPAIVGEILAGIILGPTALGALFPDLAATLLPSEGARGVALDTINTIAVVLLLLIAGLEVDLSVLWKQGKAALLVALFGTVIPFAAGFGVAYVAPDFWGRISGADPLTFALFFGVALSISALPVIAKILMDLNVFKTDVGMLIMGAAMFNDLFGWLIFSVILGMIHAHGVGTGAASHAGLGLWSTIGLTVAIVIFLITAVRWVVHRILPWIQARMSWPGGVLAFTLVLAFLGAAATEAIGVHAIFGAFLAGVAVGDSAHLREQTRTILHQFVANVFAPIFLVSIGLRVDFLAHFDPLLALGLIALGFAGKLIGCWTGARLGGLSRDEALAIGFGMNARGAMEIILGLLALEAGIISNELFVALVALALVTSVASGPAMTRFIVRPRRWMLSDLINGDVFLPKLRARTRERAIAELAQVAAQAAGLDAAAISAATMARENVMGTGLGSEIAVPHARIGGVSRPVVVMGHSEEGIDFNSPDGLPSRLIFLVLTPLKDEAAQVQIVGQIARSFRMPDARRMVYDGNPLDVIRAHIKIESPVHGIPS